MNILVTGCAGFIGFHLTKKLLTNKKNNIFGIDNLNTYYDINLKKKRMSILKQNKRNFKFFKIDLIEKKKLSNFFERNKVQIVINLAAQAGVRHSISQPREYFDSNILGFYNLIEIVKDLKIKHFIFASTSSVYGNQTKFPIIENSNTDKPLSMYAASKKCNEILAYSFSNIYKMPITSLRFFTVYGPYGRPDMALYKFVNSIYNNKTANLYNYGKHIRDFTFIDDVVNYIENLINHPPKNKIPYQVFNIGSNKPKSLSYFIRIIEKIQNRKLKVKKINKQIGDVYKTHADNAKIIKYLGKKYYTDIYTGINKFTEWFKSYYDK